MAKQSAYLARIQMMNRQREREVARVNRIMMLDFATIALGRMGKREAFFREFDKILTQVTDEFGRGVLEDAEGDPELWYSKSLLDRELKQYTGSLFAPYEKRYQR